ncbi:RNA polymerase alpha subunit C-terminal domain-containing protein [Roseivirga sp.]|uniref:RNA polymerase alpha subunit C-terminal domain-containing protein n=1 Tax=Roseivirga sp. TaxID=1964215 RepID=UPI002B26CF33|nr:RNA polymerase alpha subunit C-terminal domain-containing protein [Roseivirga sp.]
MEQKKHLKTCPQGHQYYKSSDCPTCPICEAERKPKTGFLSLISAPARRALESKDISNLKQLSQYTEKEISTLHGMGPKAITLLNTALEENNLHFKTN